MLCNVDMQNGVKLALLLAVQLTQMDAKMEPAFAKELSNAFMNVN